MKTVEDVEKFMLSLLRKWDASNYDIRIHITPLKQISTCIKADEYGDIQWMLEHMDILAERLAQQNPSLKNGTVKSYASRAKRAIREYLSWDKSPDTYPGWRCKKVKKKEKPVVATTQSQKNEWRMFPLGNERGQIVFRLPPNGLRVRDVKKIFLHLSTLASDFEACNNYTNIHLS